MLKVWILKYEIRCFLLKVLKDNVNKKWLFDVKYVFNY